jgi:hypothetical protein
MESIRSKNGFDFEQDDSKYPYKIDKFDIGNKRTTAFNYSPLYFRKKVGNGNGLYQVIGGNIPSDMGSERTFNFGNNTSSPPPALVCNLNKGTADRIRPSKSINLTPSYISRTKTGETPIDRPGTKRSESHYINREMGNLNKPNFMYLPIYQPSSSSHPRSSGYAHDDINGVCLKYYEEYLPPEAEGKCCQDGIGCVKNIKKFEFANGNLSVDTDATYATFDCLSTNYNGNIFLKDICKDKASCVAGFRLQDSKDNPCALYGVSGPITLGSCPDLGGKKKLASVIEYTIFRFGGNADCGNKTSTITVDSIETCSYCAYVDCELGYPVQIPGAIKSPAGGVEYSVNCKTVSSDKANYCGCIYNEFRGVTILSNMNSPTNKFPNWSKLTFDSGGAIIARACGAGEQYMTCNDVS